MQAPLSFQRIDAHDAVLQRHRIAKEVAALPPPAALPAKRAVGRPKRPLDTTTVLQAAAAAAAIPPQQSASKKPRGEYTNWFSSPYAKDIVAAFTRYGGARAAVTALQRSAPDDRYDRLSHSTVASWFGKDRKLLPKQQKQLDAGASAVRGMGYARVLSEAPAVEEAIKTSLLEMRAAGTPLNSRVIRWVMRAIIEEHDSALLQQLTLSQQFISAWVRTQLKWTWRARTTAASKLPTDWEAQGIQMAMRVAVNMQMHTVRPSTRAAHEQHRPVTHLCACVCVCRSTRPS